MATDMTLYPVKPGDQTYSSQAVGGYSIREIELGQPLDSMKCLGIEVDAHGPQQPLVVTDGKNQQHPLTVSWLWLEVTISTQTTPRRQVGRVHVDQKGMLPLGPGSAARGTWTWEVRQEDIETVDQARSNQPNAPIYFHLEISGIGKLVDDSGTLYDLIAVRSAGQQLKVELSQWDRLLQALDYSVPPSEATLVSRGSREHHAWADAAERLENARLHLRHGEDYDALRACLSVLEGLVSAPYNSASWKSRLTSLQTQKADGIAELLSGFATFCNKIGHHRSRDERNAAADLAQMPLDHWEAELALGIAQFVTTYAVRLRNGGLMAEQPDAVTDNASA
ncbi:MAG: hypothetical protein M0010_13590 [Actinomycetota bacterium]|nr:hypothetical protein [Actinomycetota bacterium]